MLTNLLSPGLEGRFTYPRINEVIAVETKPFFHSDRRFAFYTNHASGGFTPRELDERRNCRYGALHQIHIDVKGDNIERVVELCEAWNFHDYHAVLFFPHFEDMPPIGTERDPEPFGLAGEEMYEMTECGLFKPTIEYIKEVKAFFSDNKRVHFTQAAA